MQVFIHLLTAGHHKCNLKQFIQEHACTDYRTIPWSNNFGDFQENWSNNFGDFQENAKFK